MLNQVLSEFCPQVIYRLLVTLGGDSNGGRVRKVVGNAGRTELRHVFADIGIIFIICVDHRFL